MYLLYVFQLYSNPSYQCDFNDLCEIYQMLVSIYDSSACKYIHHTFFYNLLYMSNINHLCTIVAVY